MLTSPFPYFGGKRRVARYVWERFGSVGAYVEPFFGSGAVLLARPHVKGKEVVNDADALLTNFWRAVKHDPGEVARHADYPVSEIDLHARRDKLMDRADGLKERMRAHHEYCDAVAAGWWVWGANQWIGGGWCDSLGDRVPRTSDLGTGIQAQDLKGNSRSKFIKEWICELAARLSEVKILCGDWSRLTSYSVLRASGTQPTAIFLDPPYAEGDYSYAGGDSRTVAQDVADWAASIGDDPRYRIVYCGYEGSVEMPEHWHTYAWKANGGYGNQGDGDGRKNARRERIWFSPHCVQPEQTLFSMHANGS